MAHQLNIYHAILVHLLYLQGDLKTPGRIHQKDMDEICMWVGVYMCIQLAVSDVLCADRKGHE